VRQGQRVKYFGAFTHSCQLILRLSNATSRIEIRDIIMPNDERPEPKTGKLDEVSRST
jgi:hypothetical protein